MKINPSIAWGAVGLFLGYMLAKRAGTSAAASTQHNTVSSPSDFWTYAGSWGAQ